MLLASENFWGTVEATFNALSWLWVVVLGAAIVGSLFAFFRGRRAWLYDADPLEDEYRRADEAPVQDADSTPSGDDDGSAFSANASNK